MLRNSGYAANRSWRDECHNLVTGFGFILPVNAPGNMLALGSGTFEVRDFVRTGLVITVVSFVVLLVFAVTYWKWLGYV